MQKVRVTAGFFVVICLDQGLHQTVTDTIRNTRIAPTPSGFLHVGNILSFAITAGLAKKNNAKVLLRIDDLDQARANEEYVQDIFDTLNYLETPWDVGPKDGQDFRENWSQTHKMELYGDALNRLCDKGLVFACTCSRQQIKNSQPCMCLDKHIPLDTENAAWRLITDDQELAIRNYDGQIIHAHLSPDMQNFVIRRRDGIPAYQLASVVDDVHYNIDLIVRGQDLWSSTIAQHKLALALGESRFSEIRFYHHPLLMEESGQKLSKSAGSTSIKYLRESGLKPSDIYTLIGKMIGISQLISDWRELVLAINLS
jgi:glutamyl/glutaminyl-tRNA synthetase